MIENFEKIAEAFFDELGKIAGIGTIIKETAGKAGKGVAQLAGGKTTAKGLMEGAKKTWAESATKAVGEGGKPAGFLGRLGYTVSHDPGAALAATGTAGALGAGGVYMAGKSRGRHGY